MKHLFLLLLLIPVTLFAQVDEKYLAGAVPVVDGKVVFSKKLNLPGRTQNEIFASLLQWANNRFVPNNELQSRVLYFDPEQGQIVTMGQEYLVFTDKALALDRSLMIYQMFMLCQNGGCELKVTAIRYMYNRGTDGQEMIAAEEQITDEYTLNKDQTKLIKATGKFRIHTIDLVDKLFADATAALGTTAAGVTAPVQTTAVQTQVASQAVASPVISETSQQSETDAGLPGYRRITPDKIPGNIYKMLSEDWMLITAGDDSRFNMMTASWGGLGHMYNKPVAFCFINPSRYTYQLMENGDTYTLSFYTETYRDALNYCGSNSGKDKDKVKESGLTPITTPAGSKAFAEAWMIIECRKMVSQSLIPEALHDPQVKEKWGTQLHKMYIGEILNVWVK